MIITSLNFAGLVAITLVVYYSIPCRAQNYTLLLASYIFYATWSLKFPLVLLGFTGVNFVLAQQLEADDRTKRGLLWVGICFNLLCLAFFKYANYFLPDLSALLTRLGFQTQTEGLKVLLPIGLSFYTLQAVSYLVDVCRGQMKAATDVVDFALYMAYFPKLTAGPIERARSFLPKLAGERVVDNAAMTRSFTLIVIGLFRKLVVADTLLTAIPSGVFKTPLNFTASELTVWLLAYAFGLYNDFAGYTDIVRGISGLFGIELSHNFLQPFFSRNFNELWNRWHITLSHWLRDYIYYPLSRALVRRDPGRYNPANLILPPMITMLVSGIWHGPGWNLLVWGGLMGLYLIIERIIALRWPPAATGKRSFWRRGLSMMTVFMLVFVSLIFFRMELPVAKAYWQGLFDWNRLQSPNSRVFIVMLPSLWIDWVQYRNDNETVFLTWPLPVQSFLLALAALVIFLATRSDIGAPFIYQGF